MIEFAKEKCVRCGKCAADCVVEVITHDAEGFPCVKNEDARFCLNCQHCLAVCPSGAVTCRGVAPSDCAAIEPIPSEPQMASLIRQRRSIRSYADENLSRETLDRLEAVLAWTPTGCNRHELFFKVVADKSEMEFYRTRMAKTLRFLIRTGILGLVYPNYKRYLQEIMNGKDVVFRNAPHMIIAAVSKDSPCREADPWIALSYFDLYAQTLGLGTCWCGFAQHAFKWDPVLKKKLGVPKGYVISSVLLFGRPSVNYARSTRPEQFPVEE